MQLAVLSRQLYLELEFSRVQAKVDLNVACTYESWVRPFLITQIYGGSRISGGTNLSILYVWTNTFKDLLSSSSVRKRKGEEDNILLSRAAPAIVG